MSAAPNGTARWTLWVTVVATVGAGITGIVTYTNQIAALSSANESLDQRFKGLEKRLDEESSANSKTRSQVIALRTALSEIETQFCAEDTVRNLMHANDLKFTAILWEKSMGSKMPTDNAYYPQICNRDRRE